MTLQADAFAREVQCSLLLGATHVNVVRPHELLLTRKHAVLVTSYEAGGTLAAYCKRHRVDEPTACYFFRQLVAALAHCHAQNIAFRDVKLDNVLLDGSTPPALRLCDFGVARRWAATPGGGAGNKHFSTLAGTPGFLSPQVLGVLFSPKGGGGYDGAAADVWSAGVVLAVMLLHRLPFSYDDVAAALDGPSALRTAWEQELRTRWRAGDPKLAAALSPAALDLLDRMLEPDEAARITLADVAKHEWFLQPLPAALEDALRRQAAAQACACCEASAADLAATDAAIAEIAEQARVLGKTPGMERILSLVPDACRRRSTDVGPSVHKSVAQANDAEVDGIAPAWTADAESGCCAPQGNGCAAASSPAAAANGCAAEACPSPAPAAETNGKACCAPAAAAPSEDPSPVAAEATVAEPAVAVPSPAPPAAAAAKPASPNGGAVAAAAGRPKSILRNSANAAAAAAPPTASPAKRTASTPPQGAAAGRGGSTRKR